MPSRDLTGWFSPQAPIKPMAPETDGWARAYDYSQSVNLQLQPKTSDANGQTTYAQLHSLATSCDLVALCIATVQDRMGKYQGRVLDVGGDPRKPSKAAKAVQDWLKHPDGERSFHAWLSTLTYDMLVTDAATVYIDRKAVPPALRIVDGQTIAPRVDERGQVFMVQQIIKGQPAHDYPLDSMVWAPKNKRPNKLYGFSPVEQIKATVSLALQRTARQLDYFSAGSVPHVLIEAPANWTPQMMREASDNWNKMLAGTSGKSMAQWTPNGSKVTTIDKDVVKNEFDEWLARIVCFAFSVPPTAFVKETNRATAETTQAASIAEGHSACMRWAADLVNRCIRLVWGDGFEFVWDTDSQPDAAIVADLVKAGSLKRTALLRIGFDPEEIAEEPSPEDVAKAKAVQETAKEAKPEAKGDKVKNADTDNEAALVDDLQAYLDKQAKAAAEEGRIRFEKAIPPTEEITLPAASRPFILRVAAALHNAAADGMDEAAAQTALAPESIKAVDNVALSFARERAAEMVGMKWVDGKLITNPDARWVIDDMARQSIRDTVSRAFEEGLTPHQVSQAITEDKSFQPRRALNIARTELATAQDFGSLAYFKAAGVKGKKWSQYDACPTCQANAAQGAIPIDEAFQSGHQHAPAHPSCRCRTLPVEEMP
jgi:hypothetical protein